MNISHKFVILILMLSTLSLGACSTTSAPNDLKSEAMTMINQARSAGAKDYAPVALRDAQKHFELANNAVDRTEFKYAALMYERSITDSEYAIAKSSSVEAQKSAKEVEEGLKTLQSQYK